MYDDGIHPNSNDHWRYYNVCMPGQWANSRCMSSSYVCWFKQIPDEFWVGQIHAGGHGCYLWSNSSRGTTNRQCRVLHEWFWHAVGCSRELLLLDQPIRFCEPVFCHSNLDRPAKKISLFSSTQHRCFRFLGYLPVRNPADIGIIDRKP